MAEPDVVQQRDTVAEIDRLRAENDMLRKQLAKALAGLAAIVGTITVPLNN